MSAKADAVDLIDRAIAHINRFGFNIKKYEGLNSCYIGTLRLLDGCRVQTPFTFDGAEHGSNALKEALRTLDMIALPVLKENLLEEILSRVEDGSAEPNGRFIEKFGLYDNGVDPTDPLSGYENRHTDVKAISMLRKAKEVLVNEISDDHEELSVRDESETRVLQPA